MLNELPRDNAFRALDEIAGWLESLQQVQDFPPAHLFDVARQLDEAAQPHVRRLARDYLYSPRLSRSEEKRLWTILHGFWHQLAQIYELCQRQLIDRERGGETLKPHAPLLAARLCNALGAVLKWVQFRYGPTPTDLWLRLGRAYLLTEAGGYAGKPLQLYPLQQGATTPSNEYLRVLVFSASSMDCLMPLEIELAEYLIAHFLPGFVFCVDSRPESVYWVDPAKNSPPVRLARLPLDLSTTLRFFQPGEAQQRLLALIDQVQRGGEVPPEFNLGGQYPVRTVLPVMRHLAAYWAPMPPQRRFDRHRVKHRMAVLPGLVNAFVACSPEFGGKPAGLQVESWIVENVSRGGFGATVTEQQGDWLKVGALIAMQPEGGPNWLIGLVRRYQRNNDQEAQVGIETLARKVFSAELEAVDASRYAVAGGTPSLLIQEDNQPGELRVVLPLATFDLQERLQFTHNGRQIVLTPIILVEQGGDYEIARYQAQVRA